ncbi:lasso RiPP family leader peptide-containing protein [Streptomyces stramineus]
MEQQGTVPETTYETPELVEVGEFAELTLGSGAVQPEGYFAYFGM